jgi:serine/threonine protein kinase/Tol biopolymer transport system component
MSLSDSTLGPYNVLEKIGAGGMGEVYRARDSRLGRDVAIKALPDAFARDPERLSRFEREARLLATLSHANIAAIYGLEEVEGDRYLVLEYVEGPTLAERLAQGPMALDEAIDICRQIAAGVEAAHESGVIHRDLKPGNVKITPDGKVKVLDFGLAKSAAGGEGSDFHISHSPTLAHAATGAGVILGTAAYMSPEQARGRVVDRRTDIWSFGCVLYECLTGKQMYDGETVSDLIARILEREPDWSALPANVPPRVRELLRRCLRKDPKERLRDIGDARLELTEAFNDPPAATALHAAPVRVPAWRRGLPWAAAAVTALAGLVVGLQMTGRPELPVLRATIPSPADGAYNLNSSAPGPPAVSPDGRAVAFTVREKDGSVHLYLRPLDSPTAFRLSGTAGAAYPFWSPDAAYVGFFAEGKLKKIAAAGGPPIVLCPAQNGKGGAWNKAGVILFAPVHNTTIHRVSESGGEATPVTELDKEAGDDSHRHPRFLPDGEHFLYLARNNKPDKTNRIFVGSLKGGKAVPLIESPDAVEIAGSNLLHVRDNVLMASPFDFGKLTVGGNGVPLVEDVQELSSGAAFAVFSASKDVLVYKTGQTQGRKRLQWVTPDGEARGVLGEPGDYNHPSLSPDGSQVAVEIQDEEKETSDIWLVDVERNIKSRFTFAGGSETNPLWWPDGRSIVYAATGDTTRIFRKPIAGTGTEQLLFTSAAGLFPTSISPDGRYILFREDGDTTGSEILVHPTAEDGNPWYFQPSEANEAAAVFSPDGRWIAYCSDETGTWESYVAPFPGGGRKWQIVEGGAVYPFWSGDGAEIRVIGFDGRLTAVSVETAGDTFRALGTHPLLQLDVPSSGGVPYTFAADGARLLNVSDPALEQGGGSLDLVSNWSRALLK